MSYLYNPFPLVPDYGRGITLTTKSGEKYIDTFAGIGVNAFGYADPELVERMHQKMKHYLHLSNFIEDPDLSYVANHLLAWTGQSGEIVFTNSGTEATEVAIKTLLKARVGKRDTILYFSKSFHGRTIGSLAVNGFPKFRAPFEPLLSNTQQLPWNDLFALRKFAVTNSERILGMILEPIQGSGGVLPIEVSFAQEINRLHESIPFFLICDEIQSGLGRCGKNFAYEHFLMKPDIILLGKALGGGLPLGATLLLGKTSQILGEGDHGSTFAPSPIALAGARFLIEKLPDMLPSIKTTSDTMFRFLRLLAADKIQEIRGLGLMIGLELSKDYPNLSKIAIERYNLLINVICQRTIRLLPPLNINAEDTDLMLKKLKDLLGAL